MGEKMEVEDEKEMMMVTVGKKKKKKKKKKDRACEPSRRSLNPHRAQMKR